MRQRRVKRGVCTLHSTVDHNLCSQYSEQNSGVFELHTVGWAGKSCSLEAIGKTDDAVKSRSKSVLFNAKLREGIKKTH